MTKITGLFYILVSSLILITAQAFGAGAGITYSGRLLDPNGNAVVSNNVQFRIQIRTPGNENCLMYEEIQTKDMTNSDGVFSITINDGTGSRIDSTGYALDQIFANRGSFTFAAGLCVVGTTYNTSPADGRKLQVYFNDGSFATGQWEPTPPMAINFIPMAIESLQVGGYKKEQILKIADGVSTTGTELDATKWTNLQALINGTSTAYSKPTDQVTQLYGAAIPTPANGQSIRWNTALNAGSGGWENFTAGTASAVTSVSSANSDIAVADGSTTPVLTLNSGTGANQIVKLDGTAKLPAVDGSSLTNLSASKIVGTVINIASLTNGQVLKYNGTNWVNSSDADVLGGLSCANGRVSYYTGGSWACLEVSSGNIVNTIVSRDGSGGSNFGSVNTGTLKINDGVSGEISLTTPVTVSSYSMRLPTSVGTAGQVLTTDGNSPAQLSWSSASSQWVTSGSHIYYNTGRVGLGNTSPTFTLDIVKDLASNDGLKIKTAADGLAANWSGPTVLGGGSRGTIASPVTNSDADILMQMIGQSYSTSSGWFNAGAISILSDGTPEFLSSPGKISFLTTPSGSTTPVARMTVNNAGNVGIGTTTPSRLFHVTGDQAGGIAKIERSTSLTTGPVGTMDLVAKSTGDMTNGFGPSFNFVIKDTANVDNIISYITSLRAGADNTGDLAFMTSAGGSLSEKMRITSTGSVGIGTSSPVAVAEVKNLADGTPAFRVSDNSTSAKSLNVYLYSDSYATSYLQNTAMIYSGSATQNLNIVSSHPSGQIRFHTTNFSSTASERMRIDSTGKVGIGNTSPSANLDVAGTAGIKFTNSSSGAYVNLSNYGGSPTIYMSGVDSTVPTIINSNGAFQIYSGALSPGSISAKLGVVVTTTGAVGIGTDAPDQTFSVNGDASKAGGGSWQTFSDARLKTVNGDFTKGLEEVLKLQPISYHYNDRNPAGVPNDGDHIGFVAQDIQKVIPEAISKSKKGYLMVNNDPIIWTMFNAIKELYYKIVDQEQAVHDVQKENEVLKSKVEILEKQNQSILTYLCEKDPQARVCQ